jgi:cathepsin C
MKCSLKFFIFVVLLQCLISNILSDLPVHCLAPKMEGDWMFHMGDNYSDKDLRCGHKKPDQNLDHYDTDVEKVLKKKYEVVVMLELPDKVLSIIDRKTQVGKWTMVYDEGIELTIHDQVFFAFSRYQKVGKFSASNTDTEDTPGYKNMCDKTFLGKIVKFR